MAPNHRIDVSHAAHRGLAPPHYELRTDRPAGMVRQGMALRGPCRRRPDMAKAVQDGNTLLKLQADAPAAAR